MSPWENAIVDKGFNCAVSEQVYIQADCEAQRADGFSGCIFESKTSRDGLIQVIQGLSPTLITKEAKAAWLKQIETVGVRMSLSGQCQQDALLYGRKPSASCSAQGTAGHDAK